MHAHIPSGCGRKVQRRTTFQHAPSVCEFNGGCILLALCVLARSAPHLFPCGAQSYPSQRLLSNWSPLLPVSCGVCTSSKQYGPLLPSTCIHQHVSMQVCIRNTIHSMLLLFLLFCFFQMEESQRLDIKSECMCICACKHLNVVSSFNAVSL